MINILLVDDHKLFAEGIQLLLESMSNVQIAGITTTGKQTMQFLEDYTCDLILMDMELPDIQGFELCTIVKKNFPQLKILALTTYNRPVFVRKMLQAGASGYIIKNAEADELMLAIHTVMKDEIYVSQEVSKIMLWQMANPGQRISRRMIPKLTKREKEILKLISDEMTTKEIADKLFISESTVESHRSNLLAKLDARNSVGLVKRAIELDLFQSED